MVTRIRHGRRRLPVIFVMLPYPLGDFIDVPPFKKTDYLCGSRSCLCYADFLLCGYIAAKQLFFCI